jgi:hypothetical protein
MGEQGMKHAAALGIVHGLLTTNNQLRTVLGCGTEQVASIDGFVEASVTRNTFRLQGRDEQIASGPGNRRAILKHELV